MSRRSPDSDTPRGAAQSAKSKGVSSAKSKGVSSAEPQPVEVASADGGAQRNMIAEVNGDDPSTAACDGMLRPTLVRASAGTGKTYQLTARLLRSRDLCRFVNSACLAVMHHLLPEAVS